MTSSIVFSKDAEKQIKKVCRKDRSLCEEVKKKLLQIDANPLIGKPLRDQLKGKRRVHIGPFVLLYQYVTDSDRIRILSFSHHDEAYE
jgi:addiction module RelE/StbE family toxin